MSVLKKLRNDYVTWHANRVKIPDFKPSKMVRQKAVFAGKVQKVGFRLELSRIAQRMKLTGWVRNLADGSVEAELQGQKLHIDFLVKCMQALKRASVNQLTITDLTTIEGEDSFTIKK